MRSNDLLSALALNHYPLPQGSRSRKRPMTKALLSAVAIAFGLSLPALGATQGEFGNECVMGLALGKDIQTDCSVNTVYEGKTYCFGNETARELFLKKPDEFLLKAHIYYSSKQQ
jgi:YHS domain-containing protein